MMDTTLVIELFLVVLLIACLVYCWRVERSLAKFRASRIELEAAARELVLAVSKAEGAIKGLRVASLEAGEQLQSRINDARELADELAIMGGSSSRVHRSPAAGSVNSAQQGSPARPPLRPSTDASAWNR